MSLKFVSSFSITAPLFDEVASKAGFACKTGEDTMLELDLAIAADSARALSMPFASFLGPGEESRSCERLCWCCFCFCMFADLPSSNRLNEGDDSTDVLVDGEAFDDGAELATDDLDQKLEKNVDGVELLASDTRPGDTRDLEFDWPVGTEGVDEMEVVGYLERCAKADEALLLPYD